MADKRRKIPNSEVRRHPKLSAMITRVNNIADLKTRRLGIDLYYQSRAEGFAKRKTVKQSKTSFDYFIILAFNSKKAQQTFRISPDYSFDDLFDYLDTIDTYGSLFTRSA